MIKCILLLNILLPSIHDDPILNERIQICTEIINEARNQNVNENIALAVAWKESNWTLQWKSNGSSCYGPLQIKAKYWCLPKGGKWTPANKKGDHLNCDFLKRGIFSLNYYLKRFKKLNNALCAYAGANITSCPYASHTIKILNRILLQLIR